MFDRLKKGNKKGVELMKNVKVLVCKAKDLMRELAMIQLRETRLDDIERIEKLLKTIKL